MDDQDFVSPINEIESMPSDGESEVEEIVEKKAADMPPAETKPATPTNPVQAPQSPPAAKEPVAAPVTSSAEKPQTDPLPIPPIETPKTPTSGAAAPANPAPSDSVPAGALFKSQNASQQPEEQKEFLDPTKNKAVIARRGFPRWLTIVLSGLALLLVGGFAYFWFFYQVVVKIEPKETPDKIVINGKEVSLGTYRLMPGKNQIEISKDGYVSYKVERDLETGEKIDLNFSFQKELPPTLLAAQASDIQRSYDGTVVDYKTKDGRFMLAVPSQKEAARTTELSVAGYLNPKKYFVSDDNTFAVLIDDEALKVASFVKSDLINQVEAKLPPDPKKISDFTLNRGSTVYAAEPNSKIIYDLKTDYGWNLIFADRNHQKSEIIMDLTGSKLTNLKLDWGNSPKRVLLVGGEIGVLTLSDRSYQKISDKNDFVSGSWGPKGIYGVAQNSAGEIFKIKDNKVESTGFKTGAGQIAWVDEKKVIFLDQDKPVVFDFDTKIKINYAEVSGLSGAKTLTVIGAKIFFADSAGLKEASLTEDPYKKEG